MIVYGDPAYEASAGALLTRLRARVATAASSDLDALRSLLIEAGQLEQAARDGLPDLPSANPLQTITDRAADTFYSRWTSAGDVSAALAAMERALETLDLPEEARLIVKVPEGFAFYALYPEQYILAARRWAGEHGEPGFALVVGIRSIGTTLSAVVAATLRATGWETRRFTVRPSGHPFARTADIDPEQVDAMAWGLIVDEGPGLSGSSFAAAAEALVRAGLDRRRIVFLPGHAGEPHGGSVVSPAVREWWESTPRYVRPLHDLRWNGLPLPEALAAKTAELCRGPVERIEDLGGGMWRRAVYPDLAAWPAVCAPFERPKYRCVLASGESVLWKFEGLGTAETAFARLAALAESGWTPAPLGAALGFVATPWVEGTPLSRADAAPATLAHIGHYLVEAAGHPLAPAERSAARERLREMLYWNTWEALGEEAAARTREWGNDASADDDAPAYGDGRLGPEEWLRRPDGRILKTDAAGHDADHTIVGRQPLAWDIAGAWVEWGLNERMALPLLDAAGQGMEPVLAFYRLAYAAFRLGQTSFCAGLVAHDPEERTRLHRAAAFYKEALTGLLDAATRALSSST